jgi:hypothetical protein
MSRRMTAAEWQHQMKKWEVKCEYLDGWQSRGRPDSTAGGPLAPVGIMIHHTGSDSQAGSYITWLFKQGRPAEGIPAPLANAMSMMDGTIVMGATGKANHAGPGSAAVLAKVKAETVSLTKEEKPGPNGPNGNPEFYGNEVAFDGGQSMTNKQYASVVRWCAAICDFHGWTARSIIGHGEWTRAKWDPGMTDMAQLRRDVDKLLKSKMTATPKPTSPAKPTPTIAKPNVPALLFQEEAYSINVNGVKPNSMPRRAKVLGAEIKTSAPSILMAQECYAPIAAILGRQLPKNLRQIINNRGKVLWIDEDIWKFKRDSVKGLSLGHGKHGASMLLTHKKTDFEVVASTGHLLVGPKNSAKRIDEARKWGSLLDGHYGAGTPKLLGADWNDERIRSGGPRKALIDRYDLHPAETNVGVPNIVHGDVNSYNGYAKDRPEDGEHIDGFLMTEELFATRLRIDDHPYQQGSDHFGVEVRFGARAA